MSPSSKNSKKTFNSSAHLNAQNPLSSSVAEQWIHSQALEGPWDNIERAQGTWSGNAQGGGGPYSNSIQAYQGSVKHSSHKSGSKK
ncbi:hypothetical protein LQW54_007006 [Pestalotiopsis sp. IQ-011]